MYHKSACLTVILALASILCFAAEEKPKEAETEPIKETASEVGKWEGFRDAKWGLSPISINGLQKQFETDGMVAYSRTGDSLEIGNTKLEAILYLFYEDKLTEVAIIANGSGNHSELVKILLIRYGEPQRNDLDNGNAFWVENPAKNQGGFVQVVFESVEQTTTLTIGSRELMEKKQSDEDKQLLRGAQEDF